MNTSKIWTLFLSPKFPIARKVRYPYIWYLWNYLFLLHIYIICCWKYHIRNQRTQLPLYNPWNHVSGMILKFVYFLVVNNNKYLSHVFDNIIFGISVPDYPCITIETTFLGQFQFTFQWAFTSNGQTNKHTTIGF